ncbi:MAG: GTP-binding protein, partial [Myxococcota bacterium]
MKVFDSRDIRNVALVGHKACGKTSVAEAALWTAQATQRLGSTTAGTSVLDYEDEEQKRVMSTSTSLGALQWKKTKINLLDTPGDSNFLKDTQCALQAADGAVCVVSAKDGVEPMTERVYAWAKDAGLVRAFFISKMDADNADFQAAMLSIKNTLEQSCTAVQFPLGEGSNFRGVVDLLTQRAYLFEDGDRGNVKEADVPADMADEVEHARNTLIEDIASNDEALMEKFFEDILTSEEIIEGLAKAMAAGQIVPVFCGSGPLNRGVNLLLDMLVSSFPNPTAVPPRTGTLDQIPTERTPDPEGPLTCLCFKTIVDQHAGKISVMRVLSGAALSDSSLKNASRNHTSERLGALQRLLGKKMEPVEVAPLGDIFAVAKLKDVHTGDTLSSDGFAADTAKLAPALIARAVDTKDHGAEDKLSAALQRIVEEDPGLSLSRDAQSGQILLSGTGQQHIEVAIEKMQRKFGVSAKLNL